MYEPKRKYAEVGGPAPPKLGYSFLGWIGPVWRYTEEDLLHIVGLDAVTFLRFIRMCCVITTALSIVLGCTLIPVDLAYNLKFKTAGNLGRSTALSIITLAEMKGSFLWAHVIMSYFAVLIALYFSECADDTEVSGPLIATFFFPDSLHQLQTNGAAALDLLSLGRLSGQLCRSDADADQCPKTVAVGPGPEFAAFIHWYAVPDDGGAHRSSRWRAARRDRGA